MQKEIAAALAAAKKHKVRNDGEKTHVEFILALLQDAHLRSGYLDDYATGYDREQRVRAAQDELAAALAPDTELKP